MRQRATRLSATGANAARQTDIVRAIFADASPGLSVLIEEAIQTNVSAGVWGVTSGWTAGQLAACRAFQDSAGTIPVYAMEQPVGLLLDASGNGNSLSQPTDNTARPIYSRRVNGFIATESLLTLPWSAIGMTSAPGVLPPSGTPSVKLMEINAANVPRIAHGTPTIVGAKYIISADLKGNGRTQVRVVAEGSGGLSAYFDLSLGTVSTAPGTIDSNMQSLGDGWWRCNLVYVATTTGNAAYFSSASGGSVVSSGDDTKGFYLSRPDIRLASDSALPYIPAYQRVTSATDYDEVGFSAKAASDGLDDWLQTSSIDPLGAVEVNLVISLKRLQALGADGCLFGFGPSAASTNGTFELLGPGVGGTKRLALLARGSGGVTQTLSVDPADFASGSKAVISASVNLATGYMRLRVNGVTVAEQTVALGGAFTPQAAYFGRRAGSSLPSKSEAYGYTLAFKPLTASQLTALELRHRTNGNVY